MSCITEYNEELHLKTVRDEGREEERSILGQAFDLFYNGFNTVEKLLSKGIAKEDAEFVVKTLAR